MFLNDFSGDEARSRQVDGAGLGLAIVSRFAARTADVWKWTAWKIAAADFGWSCRFRKLTDMNCKHLTFAGVLLACGIAAGCAKHADKTADTTQLDTPAPSVPVARTGKSRFGGSSDDTGGIPAVVLKQNCGPRKAATLTR